MIIYNRLEFAQLLATAFNNFTKYRAGRKQIQAGLVESIRVCEACRKIEDPYKWYKPWKKSILKEKAKVCDYRNVKFTVYSEFLDKTDEAFDKDFAILREIQEIRDWDAEHSVSHHYVSGYREIVLKRWTEGAEAILKEVDVLIVALMNDNFNLLVHKVRLEEMARQ